LNQWISGIELPSGHAERRLAGDLREVALTGKCVAFLPFVIFIQAVAWAQDAKPAIRTTFSDHIIGENVSDWLTRSHMDPGEICGLHD
jgi:hypothetical protein